ncbi:PIN domain-containing protein [Ideonella sp.]|uniref:PIN domain-containing protein n=1 Tax=Ideonella sp. TaxID=1929293 RepID=UPI0035B46B0D
MKNNYVLVDYENVQPDMASLLAADVFKVLVFVGAAQTKIGFELANLLATKNNGSKFIKISSNGRNALDFHIAYYIGRLSTQEPDAYFHVISADKGMDPLIDYLQHQGIHASRCVNVQDIAIVKTPAAATSEDERLSTIIEYLVRRGSQRPASLKTLQGSIAALFQPKLDESEASSLLQTLQQNGVFDVSGNRVTYCLPDC